MQQVKNIIFDLGGVFMDIDFALTQQAFEALGVTQFHTMFTQHYSNDLFELLETGKINEADFYEAFRKETNTALTDEQIKEAWNALLIGFKKEKIDWLRDIKNRYRIFLFSNTNQIHYDAFINMYASDCNGEDFNQHFIKAYYSHEMGLRKPYAEAFEFILQEQQLQANETLFVDDTIANVEAAKQLGMPIIHLLKPMTVLDLNL